MVGKWIFNLTDVSFDSFKTVNTDALVTTRLIVGTDNTWSNSDVWVIEPESAALQRLSHPSPPDKRSGR